ncbi:TPA: hypothetical protein KOO93_004096 [Clostridioides difficile]|nr:hypothetical protein [Clostridioides difficile]HBF3423976.1 hypothetical protein [Clostridioides difficile]HBF4770306.1 hypothetical protein [Clostridioides difficile]HBF4983836.1 hypothetical protein [Clostridioides difficile]HBF5346450.1 hypothetical protein [Clostridioides difficile]
MFYYQNKKYIGKAVQLYETKFDCNRNCIVTYADEKELVLMYYDKEIEELIYKTLTKEDLIFNDYELKLLS